MEKRQIIINKSNNDLDEAVKLLMEQLKKVPPGTPEQDRISTSLERIYRLQMEEEKMGASFEEMGSRMDALEADTENKQKATFFQTILRGVEVAVEVGVAIGSIVGFVWRNEFGHEVLDFEKTGTPSSNTFRKFYNDVPLFRKKTKDYK